MQQPRSIEGLLGAVPATCISVHFGAMDQGRNIGRIGVAVTHETRLMALYCANPEFGESIWPSSRASVWLITKS
jgi:hypothetical protein